ncbi:MAG: AAC(3) family N-acetyltransferase [Planctomycetota bacterium]|nr:AAC(3) family N-acetyltransferase [Planctomycetota bacterium]
MTTSIPTVTQAQIEAALRELGLSTGDSVIVHSSLSSFGRVEGGADSVVGAVLSAIGPKGNLMLPTFNYTRPIPLPYFDPAVTPGHTGAVPEAGRKRPNAVRSLHPSHSVAVIGPDAVALTQDHLKVRAFGIGSPIDRLAQLGGKVLLLGVTHTSNSLLHIAEEYAKVPKVSVYPDPLPLFKIRMPDGKIIEHQIDSSSSCSLAFGGAEYILRRHGEVRDLRGLGKCNMQLMSGQAVLRRVGEILSEKPDVLLCTFPGCRPCAGARGRLREQGRLA